MSPSSPASARSRGGARPARSDLVRLLRDLGSGIRRGLARDEAAESSPALATGLAAVDELLGGGFAPGSLSELTGPPSSGRTALALALLARTTAAGGVVAVVDGADAFHPLSATAAGVRLERVLWARPPAAPEAVRCCDRLLRVRGFAVVLLDTAGRETEWEALPDAVWQRLARAGAATRTALIVLSGRRVTGSLADLALALQPTRVRFRGTPSLFEGLEIEAAIVRRRRGPLRGPTALRLRAESAD
jgi:hypothetical protein